MQPVKFTEKKGAKANQPIKSLIITHPIQSLRLSGSFKMEY